MKRATSFDGGSDPDRCWSAQCKTAILFLSDGSPNQWTAAHRTALQNQNPNQEIKLFTYAFGGGIPASAQSTLQTLATDHGGQYQLVADGGNLGNAMADYYKTLTADRDVNAVRWMQYSDIYKRRSSIDFKVKSQIIIG